LINSISGALAQIVEQKSSIPFWKKFDMIVLFNSKNGTKVAKLAKYFDVPTTMLTTV